jgi:site-specific recombinase XerD
VDTLDPDLEELWSDYRRSLARRGRSPQTESVYRKAFLNFWKWASTAGIPADTGAVDVRVVNAWSDALATMPAIRNGRPIEARDPDTGVHSPKTLDAGTRRILWRNLRPFFSWYAKEFDTDNPFTRADPPGDDRPRPIPVVALEDLKALLATCTGKDFRHRRDQALLRVMIDTGARLGEIVSMTVEGWDRRQDLLLVTGKTGTRYVPISLATGEALARYVRERKTHRYAQHSALWLASKGPLSSSGVGQILKARCEQAGIPPINPHRLRHTWAHEFRKQGGSEGDLMYLAGWSSPAMAHRYGHSAAAERAQESGRRLGLGDRL